MNEKIEISRDKKNPTWAYVWDGAKPDNLTDDNKRIIIDVCRNGCVCVELGDEIRYCDNATYEAEKWKDYEIIKEPTYRKFETIKEYIEATKDRKDLRVISKQGKKIINLDNVSIDSIALYFCECKYNSKEIFYEYVWLDDRSPVGVKK